MPKDFAAALSIEFESYLTQHNNILLKLYELLEGCNFQISILISRSLFNMNHIVYIAPISNELTFKIWIKNN